LSGDTAIGFCTAAPLNSRGVRLADCVVPQTQQTAGQEQAGTGSAAENFMMM